MKKVFFYVLFLCCVFLGNSQDLNSDSSFKNKTFILKGTVQYDDKSPIDDVEVLVNGSAYSATNKAGEFRIQVKKGDQLEIKHNDFETVYYTVKDDDRLTVNVESSSYRGAAYVEDKAFSSFYTLLDSAKYYKNSSLDKSITFIEQSIRKSRSKKDNAEAFETLADIYFHWKQYDLAITNYRISLQNEKKSVVYLKLAKSYEYDKNYTKSIAVYNNLGEDDLGHFQQIELNEGIADVYFKTSKLKEALAGYKQALNKAKAFKINNKVTDLNSKIGAVYSKMGANEAAEEYYDKSLKLAGKETKKRAVTEADKNADFQNKTQDYESEISLRKEVLKEIENPNFAPVFENESSLTPQKQNYKIGNAFYLQNNLEEAVPYLEKSIQQASDRKDLVVEKDATKKLSEVYSAAKNYNKALESYKDYTSLVEELYIKKEQEISQAIRFSKRLSEKQNRIQSLETDRQLTISQINLSKERNKRQQFYIYALIGGLLLVVLVVYLMYKYIKQQRLANNLLALKSLRSQMNPHFIFNALNSVNSFIAINDERTANKYLSDFSKLMRAVLENSEEDFIPLEKEIDLIELYTKLEHFRFQDKFDYKIEIDEAITVSDFNIPPMLLQPYIENAVWHGLRYREEKGELTILINEERKDEIKISITDNGIGRAQSKALKTSNQKKHNSKGLGNIQKRVSILNAMYKDKITVTVIDNPNESGTQVSVILKK